MRQQVTPGKPVPLLVARKNEPPSGRCVSCGEPVPPDNLGRCGLCVAAAVWVLQEVRQRP